MLHPSKKDIAIAVAIGIIGGIAYAIHLKRQADAAAAATGDDLGPSLDDVYRDSMASQFAYSTRPVPYEDFPVVGINSASPPSISSPSTDTGGGAPGVATEGVVSAPTLTSMAKTTYSPLSPTAFQPPPPKLSQQLVGAVSNPIQTYAMASQAK